MEYKMVPLERLAPLSVEQEILAVLKRIEVLLTPKVATATSSDEKYRKNKTR
jgi:hypothetical protein